MTAAIVGIGSGALHAVSGPDHLLGVAPHAGSRRRGAWRVGAAWGAGHAVGTAVVAGGLLALAAAAQVSVVERWAERAAGVALVAVGVLGLVGLRRTPGAGAVRPEPVEGRTGGLRSAAAVGVLHGALGAAALVAVVAGVAETGVEQALFLAGFSAGSTAAMAGLTAALARAGSVPLLAAMLPRVPRVASVMSIALGVGWIVLA